MIYEQKDLERVALAVVELCARRLDAKATQHHELARTQGLGGRHDLASELHRVAQTHTETAAELRKLAGHPPALLNSAIDVYNDLQRTGAKP